MLPTARRRRQSAFHLHLYLVQHYRRQTAALIADPSTADRVSIRRGWGHPRVTGLLESNHEMCRAWPGSGTIEFQDVTARYRPGLPPVLSGLTFTVEVRADDACAYDQLVATSCVTSFA